MRRFLNRLLAVALSFCGLLFSCRPAVRASDSTGIDIILLIDVSGSMAEKSGNRGAAYETGEWDGSDPQRIRWDAVKLLVDMLDANDRILILRFNQTCPANSGQYRSVTGNTVGPWPERYLPGRIPLTEERDFRHVLEYCDGRAHAAVSQRIAHFNHPLMRLQRTNPESSAHEDGWELDGGGTNILEALSVLNAPVTNRAASDRPERPKRIILLTDGCDQNIDDFIENPDDDIAEDGYEPRVNVTRLRQTLQFLNPSERVESKTVVATAQVPRIPVYTVGLNLKELPIGKMFETEQSIELAKRRNIQHGNVGDRCKVSMWDRQDNVLSLRQVPAPHYQQQKARALLREISNLTGGESKNVDTADELLETYAGWIRDLKGLWYKRESVAPQGSKNLTIPVVSAVADFRMLARVRDTSVDSTTPGKWASRPPLFDNGRWEPPEPSLIVPALRQGSGDKLYALWFGGDLTTPVSGTTRPTPFARLDRSVNWIVPVGREKSSIETIQFKRVLEDFGWPPKSSDPVSELRFFRHQLATIQLSAVTDLIQAEDFEWKLRRHEREKLEDLAIPFRSIRNEMLATFDSGQVCPQAWTKDLRRQSLVWSLVGQGKPAEPQLEKVLTGFSRVFPPWRFSVVNELPLRVREPIASLTLSDDVAVKEWTVETQFEHAVPRIPLKLIFQPPHYKDADGKLVHVAAELLELAVIGTDRKVAPLSLNPEGSTSLPLIDGQVRLRIKFHAEKIAHYPPPDSEMVAGRLRIEPDLTDLPDPDKFSIILPVALVIDRPPLEFYDDSALAKRRMLASLAPNTAELVRTEFYLAPIKPRDKGRKITLTLDYLSEPKDPENQPLRYAMDELRILDQDGKPLEQEAGAWVATYDGKPIRLILETALKRDRKADTRAMAKLTASGAGFSPGAMEIRWSFEPRSVRIALAEGQETVFAEPGRTATYVLEGTIDKQRDGGRVPVTAEIRKRGLRFECVDPSQSDSNFFLPLENFDSLPVSGTRSPAPQQTLLRFSIPEGLKIGEYQAQLGFEETAEVGEEDVTQIVPTRLVHSPVTLKLILDQLIAEVQDPHDPAKWIPAIRFTGDSVEHHFQFYGYLESPMERTFRVRSERGEPLKSRLSPLLEESYPLETDTRRQAADHLSLIRGGNTEQPSPEWTIKFPALLNRDPDLDFGAKFQISRDGALQRTIKFKLRLLVEQ